MEKLVAVDACDEEVDMAVVVVVSGGDTHSIAFAPYAGRFGDVSEPAVSVITIEAIEIAWVGFIHLRQARSVHEINIGKAVVVVIEHGHAGQHGLDLMLVRGS